MRILHVTNYFKPLWEAGGVARSAYEMTKKIHDCGHSVTVFTTNRIVCEVPKTIKKYDDVDGLNVWYFKNYFAFFPIKTIPLPIFAFLKIRQEIQNFDIIHIHEHRTLLAIIVTHYAKKNDIPYVVQAHGSVLPTFEKQWLKKIFDLIWGTRILKNASKCIALTKTESDQYNKMGVPENKIVIIPNGLDLSQFSNLPERGTFRSKYGISDNEQIILFLGRIHKIKGIDLLIDAYSLLLEELPHTQLVIAGPDDGNLSAIQEQIQRLKLKRKPLITGPLYGRDKLAAYVDADVYVLPSLYETYPITVLEAWACGTPVIVTTGCHIADIVEKAGIVIHRDPVEMKGAIEKIIKDDKLKIILNENAIFLLENNFNWLKIMTQFEELYMNIKDLYHNKS